MSRKIFLGCIAICAIFNIVAAQSVSAYSIDLSIEKKEICIDDIPADRKVSLAISIYNNPSTDQIGITIIKDSALSFVGIVPIDNVDPIFFNKFSSGISPNNKDTANFNFWCSPNYYTGNNTLAYVNVRLPENVSAGSFYPVNFTNNNELYISYTNESGNKDYLLADSFNLKNGGIQITSSPQPTAEPVPVDTVPVAPPPVQEPQIPAPPDPNPVRQQPENTQAQTNATVAAETSSDITSASSDTFALSVSSSLSEKKTSHKSPTVSSSEKSSDTTKLSDTEADYETTSVSNNQDDNKKSKSSPAPFIAAAVVLAAATAVIILKIKGRKS